YVADLRAHFAARRAQVIDGLSRIDGVCVAAPAGSFFAFFTIDGVTDSAAFAVELLRDTGVALAPGSAFGPGGEAALRLCFASSEETIAESLNRLRQADLFSNMYWSQRCAPRSRARSMLRYAACVCSRLSGDVSAFTHEQPSRFASLKRLAS